MLQLSSRLILGAGALALAAGHAGAANCTAAPVNGELYSILNLGSNKVLDLPAGTTQPNVQLQQWGYSGGAHQQFTARQLASGAWTLQARHSGMMLDLRAGSPSDGAAIVQYAANGGSNQQWLLKKSSTGAYNIVSVISGKSLTIGSDDKLVQSADTASASQRWFFNPVSGACGGMKAVGFAGASGSDGLATTTGGGSAAPITVTTCSALASALQSASPAVVRVPANTTIDCRTAPRTQMACAVACPSYQDPGKYTYRIPVGTQTCTELGASNDALFSRSRNETRINVASNKTLIGMDGGAKLVGANLELANVKNVIIRNLTIENVNPGLVEAGDAIGVNNASHVWIDHVSFNLISDGHVDIAGSRNVTLSFNRFNGVNSAVCGNQHHYTNMVQDSTVTLHHNFWDRTSGRNPKVSGPASRAHLYNNYWFNIPYFAINADASAQVRVEGNFFANAARPHWNAGTGKIDASLASNRYTGISATDPERDTGAIVFGDVSMYPYTIDKVDDVPTTLTNGAGAR
jgi:pectate lyase